MNIFNHKNLPISYKSINILLLALAILPACFLGILILIYSVDVPVLDQWGVPPLFEKLHNGSLSFIDLLAQHNESRKFFPRLIFLSLGYLTHWDVRYEMLIIFLLACVVSINVYLLSNITVSGSTVKKLFLAIISNLLIFSPVQWENWLFGIQIVVFVPIVCITTCILVAYSRLATRTKFLISMCLSTISTFSYANGILCWVVILPVLILKSQNRLKKNRALIFVWIAGFILNAVVYFYNYKKPSGHPSFSEVIVHPLQAVHYFLSFLGAPFAFVIGINRLTAATIIGFVLLVIFLASCLYVIKFATDSVLVHRIGGWLTIGLYAILSDITTTSGRVGFGVEQSLSGRYTTFSIYLTLSLVYIVTIIIDDLKTRDYLSTSKKLVTQSISFLAVTFLVLHLLTSIYAVQKMSQTRIERLQAKSCLLFINIVPEQECLVKKVFPDITSLKVLANILNNLGYLKPALVKNSNIEDIKGNTNLSAENYGKFNKLFQESPGVYIASGWAVLPERREPSDAVILTYQNIDGDSTVFAVIDEKNKSKKAAKVLKNNSYSNSGWEKSFSSINFPKGDIKIDAWAFDTNTGKAFKLNGTHKITDSQNRLASFGVNNVGEIKFKPVVGSSPNGFFDLVNGSNAKTIEVKKTNFITANGWAILVDGGRPADRVLITYGENNSLITVAPVNLERPDVAKGLQNDAYFKSGWNVPLNFAMLPAEKVVLKAWAYDAARKEATQLNNSFEVVVLK